MRGGETPIELTQEEQRTNKIVKGVVTDVMKELKKGGVLDAPKEKDSPQQTQRQDTFSENRPTGLIEQILLAPVRIPVKIAKLPFKLYKAPFKFLKKFVF